MARSRGGIGNARHGKKKDDGFDKNVNPYYCVKYEYDHSSSNKQELLNRCCRSINSKTHDFRNCNEKHYPAQQSVCLPAIVVFPQRDTVTLPPFQSASQGMARLRGQDD
jgi:hypothetical protein